MSTCTLCRIRRCFRSLPGAVKVSDDQRNRIMEAAMRPEVWHTSPVDSVPGRHLGREFDALREAVGPALDSTRPDAVVAQSRPARAPRGVRTPLLGPRESVLRRNVDGRAAPSG